MYKNDFFGKHKHQIQIRNFEIFQKWSNILVINMTSKRTAHSRWDFRLREALRFSAEQKYGISEQFSDV